MRRLFEPAGCQARLVQLRNSPHSEPMSSRSAPHPLVDLGADHALIVARLRSVAPHAHAVPAVVVGLDGPFIYADDRDAREVGSVLIRAGHRHRLECDTRQMLIVYFTNPSALRSGAPGCPLPAESLDIDAVRGLRTAALDASDGAANREALQARLARLIPAEPPRIDERLERAMDLMREDRGGRLSLQDLADEADLSPSRLMHLLRSTFGVPFRQLRAWERMRRVTEARAGGDSLTEACLAAGFADSSHFAHAFRKMFGVTASTVLGRHARVRSKVVGPTT